MKTIAERLKRFGIDTPGSSVDEDFHRVLDMLEKQIELTGYWRECYSGARIAHLEAAEDAMRLRARLEKP